MNKYRIRCSSLDRILNCAHSLRLLPITSYKSNFASSGSKIHAEIEEGETEDFSGAKYLEYLSSFPDVKKEFACPEYSTDTWRLTGTVDAWVKDENTLHIIDFKSGYERVSHLASMQLRGYAFLLIKSGIECEYVTLTIFQESSPRSITLPKEIVLSLERQINDSLSSWTFQPGSYCKYCPGAWCCQKLFSSPDPVELMENKKAIENALTQAESYTKKHFRELWHIKKDGRDWKWKKGVEIPQTTKDLTPIQALEKLKLDVEHLIDKKTKEKWKWVGRRNAQKLSNKK